MSVTFTSTVTRAERMNATKVEVPSDVISALGGTRRPAVIVTLAGYTYRSTVAAYGSTFTLHLSQEHRAAAGLAAGDKVEITLALDTAPRTVDVPDDLAAAIVAAGARDRFDRLAPSHRKEHVRSVQDAKTQATRDRRIAAVVAKLTT